MTAGLKYRISYPETKCLTFLSFTRNAAGYKHCLALGSHDSEKLIMSVIVFYILIRKVRELGNIYFFSTTAPFKADNNPIHIVKKHMKEKKNTQKLNKSRGYQQQIMDMCYVHENI